MSIEDLEDIYERTSRFQNYPYKFKIADSETGKSKTVTVNATSYIVAREYIESIIDDNLKIKE